MAGLLGFIGFSWANRAYRIYRVFLGFNRACRVYRVYASKGPTRIPMPVLVVPNSEGHAPIPHMTYTVDDINPA